MLPELINNLIVEIDHFTIKNADYVIENIHKISSDGGDKKLLYTWLRNIIKKSLANAKAISPPVKKVCQIIVSELVAKPTISLVDKRLSLVAAVWVNKQSLQLCIEKKCDEHERLIEHRKLGYYYNGYGSIQNLADLVPTDYIDIFTDIANLVTDGSKCIELLKNLDSRLEKQLLEKKIDLCHFDSTDNDHYIFLENIWPILQIQTKNDDKTFGILDKILWETARESGINADFVPSFAGFIDKNRADQCVKDGYLFKEFIYAGDVLHGKYTHLLLWEVIRIAAKIGIVDLRGKSLAEVAKQSVTVWSQLLDTYNQNAGFRSPYLFHSALLLCDQLPTLRRYLRKVYHYSLQKIATLNLDDDPDFHFAKIIICNEVTGFQIDSFFKTPSVVDYYSGTRTIVTAPTIHGSLGTIFHKESKSPKNDAVVVPKNNNRANVS